MFLRASSQLFPAASLEQRDIHIQDPLYNTGRNHPNIIAWGKNVVICPVLHTKDQPPTMVDRQLSQSRAARYQRQVRSKWSPEQHEKYRRKQRRLMKKKREKEKKRKKKEEKRLKAERAKAARPKRQSRVRFIKEAWQLAKNKVLQEACEVEVRREGEMPGRGAAVDMEAARNLEICIARKRIFKHRFHFWSSWAHI